MFYTSANLPPTPNCTAAAFYLQVALLLQTEGQGFRGCVVNACKLLVQEATSARPIVVGITHQGCRPLLAGSARSVGGGWQVGKLGDKGAGGFKLN